MNYEIAMKWADALDSGKYQQGYGCLHNVNDDSFCCLGVLCDISKQGEWRQYFQTSSYICADKLHTLELPTEVTVWANMKTVHGYFDNKLNLIKCNDTYKLNFKEIANIIRENWEKL